MSQFEGAYLRSEPSRAAVSEARQMLSAFVSSPQGQSVTPRPTQNTLAVVDFSQGSRQARGIIVGDPPARAFLVAHGSGHDGITVSVDDSLPPDMSNRHGSHLSSAGLFISKSIVPSGFDRRLRMFGVCAGLNDNSDARLIGMHPYTERYFAKYQDGRYAGIGTSFGCPAVSEFVASQIMPRLDGGFIYIYHPQHRPRGWTSRPHQSRHHANLR